MIADECVFTYGPIHFQNIFLFYERIRDDQKYWYRLYDPRSACGCCGSPSYKHDAEVLPLLGTLKCVHIDMARFRTHSLSSDRHCALVFFCWFLVSINVWLYSGHMNRISYSMIFQSRAVLTTFGMICSFDFGLFPGKGPVAFAFD